MSKENVEKLLIAGGEDKHMREKYNEPATMEEFVEFARKDGYDFTVEELSEVLKESGDVFDKHGNPPKRSIWWT